MAREITRIEIERLDKEYLVFTSIRPCSQIAADSSLPMEGIVARPAVELKNRRGGRVIVKIKARDFA